MNKIVVDKYIIRTGISITDAMKKINDGVRGVAFVVNDKKELIGSISDGDIRRYLIKAGNTSDSIDNVYNKEPKFLFDTEYNKAETYFNEYKISTIPIVGVNKKIVDIIFKEVNETNINTNDKKDLSSVNVIIMAGGKGTRLYPYTKVLPKPLIPIGDIPIIERIINKFYENNIKTYYVTVNYMKNMIKAYFNDQVFPYEVNFVEENTPLGTAGSISLIQQSFKDVVFVTNCDILIDLDYGKLYDYHKNSKNDITVVAALKNTKIPYGVLNIDEDGNVKSMEEKPVVSHYINSGLYAVNPEMLKKIPKNTFYNMPDLVQDVMNQGGKVGILPVNAESFLDMGEFSEMKRMEDKIL